MASKTKSKSKKGGGGLSVRTFGGLNKKRYTKKSGGGDRVQFDEKKPTVCLQFVAPIDDADWWVEIEQHVFREDGKWNYVPCLGEGCPLCEDEDSDVSKTSYRFFTCVWNFKTKRYEILEGPKDMSGRIAFRYEKKKKSFLSRTWDVTRMDTTPVSYDVESGDKAAIKIDKKKLIDVGKYIDAAAKRYFGDDMPTGKTPKRSALDDDDYDEDDEYDEDELLEMDKGEVKDIAKSLGIKLKDKDDEPRSKKTLIKLILKRQEG